MTELSPLGSAYMDGPGTPLGSSGLIGPCTEGKVVCTETGQDLPFGEDGEICIRGPQVMKGYLNVSH
jgi:long-subunit acyl-CoA synthetase (AMP-forming)